MINLYKSYGFSGLITLDKRVFHKVIHRFCGQNYAPSWWFHFDKI